MAKATAKQVKKKEANAKAEATRAAAKVKRNTKADKAKVKKQAKAEKTATKAEKEAKAEKRAQDEKMRGQGRSWAARDCRPTEEQKKRDMLSKKASRKEEKDKREARKLKQKVSWLTRQGKATPPELQKTIDKINAKKISR